MKIMGILNVTPDSFSDGGLWAGAEAAIARGQEMVAQGAQIIDIGGESTRPGSTAISAAQEWQRIGEVVTELSKIALVSVDTYHAQTAQLAVNAGATIVNDVSGGRIDAEMFSAVAELDCKYILQHSRGTFETMNSLAVYDGEINDVIISEMLAQRDLAIAAGIAAERIILDPGLGFAKCGDQDWQVLRAMPRYLDLGHEILIGHSRKRFVGALASQGLSATERDYATAALSGILDGAQGQVSRTGVWAVRVHNVEATRQAIAVHRKMRMLDLQATIGEDAISGSHPSSSADLGSSADVGSSADASLVFNPSGTVGENENSLVSETSANNGNGIPNA